MASTPPETWVRDSYDRNSQLYLAHVEGEMQHVSLDRASLRLFAELIGPGAKTLDVGCGPGHIAAFLAAYGLAVSGLDISPAMIELAQVSFPHLAFSIGRLADLPMDDRSFQGVVSRHSVIHTEPERLGDVFAELARVLVPGGRLFLSFFAANDAHHHGQPFDHAVCTAYQIDPSTASSLLANHGLDEEIRLLRQPQAEERQIPHATLIARRSAAVTQ